MNAPGRRFVPEALLLDVPEIDAEHEAIFNLLACLKNCCLTSDSPELVQAESMIAKLRSHFETEERLALEAGEDFSLHAQKHEELLQVVANLLDATRQGKSNAFSLLRYVEYWCERHINEEDKRLGACLKQSASRIDGRDGSLH